MSDIFYHAISFGLGLLTGGLTVGGIVSQQLGNRLIDAHKKAAEQKASADAWFGFYTAAEIRAEKAQEALDAAEARAMRGRPARAANGRYTKAA